MKAVFVILVVILVIAFSNLLLQFLGVNLVWDSGLTYIALAGGALAIVLQGLRKIPADPPTIALVTLFGERIAKVKREGWRFFLGYPFIYGYIPVVVQEQNEDLTPEQVFTPDRVSLKISIQYTYVVAYELGAKHVITFKNVGGDDGVKDQLNDIIAERVREWAISGNEGPRNFEQALGAEEEAVAILLRTIVGDGSLPQLPHVEDIPTHVLMKILFRGGEGSLLEADRERWKNEWKKHWEDLTEIQREEVKTAVKERMKKIREARSSNGKFLLEKLGIFLKRLNVGEISPIGEISKSLDLQAKEELEKKAEQTELDHFISRVKRVAEELKVPTTQAAEYVQTERKKVTKNVDEKKLSVDPSLTGLVLSFLSGKHIDDGTEAPKPEVKEEEKENG